MPDVNADPQALTALTPELSAQVSDLQERATAADGVSALSEQSVLALRSQGSTTLHLLLYAGQQLGGYAQADLGGEAASVELVVHPDLRRRGLGTDLWQAVAARHPDAQVWAHGDLAPARGLAAALGLSAVRELHKMSRPRGPGDTDPAASLLPPGFHARAFEPGRDEEPWLETNAAAFAHHPEQGRLTLADLRERMGQEWFDPAGFLLVEADGAPGQVAAFHWTKVDPGQRSAIEPGATAGEVYVVGVHPAYQGRGLARPLTAMGLAHLAALGLPEVVLFVDGDNAAAQRTYTGLGFHSIMVDVMYSSAVHPGLSG
jgi:mycothiol synthase